LSGQHPETGKDGVSRWVDGNEEEVKVKINQLVKTLHGEHAQSLVYANKYAEAESFVKKHVREFGDKSNDTLMLVEARREAWAHKVEREQAEARHKAVLAKFDDDWNAVKDLPDEEVRHYFVELTADMDREERNKTLALMENDLEVRAYQTDKRDAAIGLKLINDARKNNWSQAQFEKYAIDEAEKQGVSEKGIALLRKQAAVLDVETKENRAAFYKTLNDIDNKIISDPTALSNIIFQKGMTQQQSDYLQKYFEDGGKKGRLYAKYSDVKSIVKRYGADLDKKPELYDWIVKNMPPGDITNANIQETVIKALEPVYVEGGVFSRLSTSRRWEANWEVGQEANYNGTGGPAKRFDPNSLAAQSGKIQGGGKLLISKEEQDTAKRILLMEGVENPTLEQIYGMYSKMHTPHPVVNYKGKN
jgi:hypothetical protein